MEIDTASSRLHAYLNIRLSIVFKFQEIPNSGLGGVALTRFFPIWCITIKYQRAITSEQNMIPQIPAFTHNYISGKVML